MKILKNPIILAIIVGAVVFVIMYYYCGDAFNKKNKNKNKNKDKDTQSNKIIGNKETVILVSVIASLLTWFIAQSYFCQDKDNQDNQDSQDSQHNQGIQGIQLMTKQQGGKNKIPSITSDGEEQTRSYNLIGSGLNIPNSELKLPKVLIDYN